MKRRAIKEEMKGIVEKMMVHDFVRRKLMT
jgi:hypothetical protein